MRKPIETSQFMTLPLPPAQRIERIRATLEEERTAYRSAAAGSHDEHIAQLNVGNLEATLERAETNESIGLAAKQERLAAEDAKTQAHQEREQAELESSLRQQYERAAAAPVTDAQWEKVRPDVLHQHRMRQMGKQDELVAAALTRYRI
jgi:hypothetical protein